MKRALPTAKSGFLATFFCVANLFFASVVFGQTVTLDQADLDYAPGETVYITGTGWQPNEVINLQIHHLTEPIPDHGTPDPHLPWTILADSSGSFDASWYVTDFELGSDLLLVANGVESGFAYEVFFTDGTPTIESVSNSIISPNQLSSIGVNDNTLITSKNSGSSSVADFRIRIYNSSSILIKEYLFTAVNGNEFSSATWDGKNTSGTYVADGTYSIYAANATTNTTTPLTKTGVVIVDNTNPTVALNTPIANEVVNGTIDFEASPLDLGGDDSNIDKVEFYLDGGLIGTDSSINSGWKISYNTTGTSGTTDGAHTWYVKVFDNAGNNVTSGTRAISVLNATSGSIASVGIGTQSGVSVYGAVSTPSYNITSVRGSNGTVNGTYSVTGLPTGVTSSFDSSATFTANGSTSFPVVTLNLNVPANLNAGSYNFTISLSDGSSTVSASGTLTITKASITVVNTNRSKVYGETLTDADYSGSITGVVAGDAITVTRASTGGVATATVAGSTYPIVGTLVDPNGRLANYNVSNSDGALTVTKASITVVNTSRSKLYGETLTDADYSGSITGVVADDAITVTRASTGDVATATVAGSTYPIVGTLVDPNGRLANYNVSNSDGALTVTKASITVVNTSRSKVYGETLTDADYSGSITGVVADDAITVTRASTGDVATATVAGSTYPIVGTLVDPNSRLANYNVSNSDGALTVTKASITVVNTNRSKVYGETLTDADYSGSVTGVVADDAITVTRASTGGVATATVANSTYPIVGTLVDPNGRLANYNVTNPNGILTVTKASITVVNANRSKVYGETLTDADYSGSVTGVVADDAITVTRASTGGVATATATVADSTYPIVGTLVDPNGRLANYNVSNSDGALTVTKASITVVNTSRSKVYGETLTDADYSGSITGVVADDAITVTRASTGDVATATVAGSTYPIVGTLVDPNGRLANYNVSNSDGALTVTKASITVVNTSRSKVYGETLTDADYSGSITGVVADDAITVTRASTGDVATATVAGSTYPIVGTLVDPNGRLANYDVTNPNGILTVTKASITVVNANRSKVYGETLTDADYSGSVTGVVADDAITVTRASTGGVATATVANSTYPIVGTLVDPNGRLANYNVTNPNGILTVTKASITVVNANRSKVYGETLTDADYSGSITGVVAGDAITVTRSSTGGVATATVADSTYPIVGTLVDPNGRLANYNVTNPNGTLTVTKAVLSVTANDKTRQYSDANPVLTVTIEGFVNDDNKDDLTTVPTASTLANASSPVGTYPIIASSGVDDNYSFVYFSGTLTVIQEDACAYYTGALFASTANATSSNATITLAATIKELTDSSAGNITNAKVYFMIDELQKTLGPFTPGIVTSGDNTVGTVVYNWLVDIGNSNSLSYNVRVIVEGYYSGTCGDAQSVVTVSKPLDDFITGGGYLKLTSSSGIKAGDIGTKNNFGFNVKFNKSKTNLQGNINTIIRRTESDGLVHIYQIKGNSMTSLSVQPAASSSAPIATFNGKANIQDITNPLAPISVEGNATLQVTMVDNGEPGAKSDPMDRISITVWNKSGGLWFASNWNGAKTVDQNIAQGNLKVRSSGSFVSGTALSNTFLASSLVPSTVGQSVIFTATVAGSGTSIPSGTITFIDYSTNTTLAKVSLNKGIATYSTSSLILGVHEIYAYYGGDSKYSSSANSLTQTVNAPLAGRTILATSTKKDVLGLTEPTSLDVKIYPNPAQYQFTLELEGGSSVKVEVVVYDLLGRMVKHIEDNDMQPINFGEDLPAGTYIVTVSQGENQKTIKLIKQ